MGKEAALLASLTRYFEIQENRNQLHDVLTDKDVSLRRLEWFVTNYAKTRQTQYAVNGKMFTIHVAYKSSLDGYSKKLFDPFCRTERITFQGLTTTVAQLNFLRWCMTNKIIDALRDFKELSIGEGGGAVGKIQNPVSVIKQV